MRTHNISKILLIILLCVILVTTAALGIAITNFHSGGIHFLGTSVHIVDSGTCYFMDTKSNEITGQSTCLLRGYYFKNHFTGTMNIDQYPLTFDDMTDFSYRRINSDLVLFESSSIKESSEYLGKEWLRYYNVWVCPGDLVAHPKAIVIEIFEHDEYIDPMTPNIVAVCAESEEEARANYEIYKECRNK